MPIPRLEALLTERGLTVFQPCLESDNKNCWFDGRMLTHNGLTLYWGMRNHTSGDAVIEIRLVRNSSNRKTEDELILFVCQHADNTEPRMVFGGKPTPSVNSLMNRYRKSPKPSFDDLLAGIANDVAHDPAV